MGVISPDALEQAIRLQKRRLGEILIEENLVQAELVAQALREQASQVKDRQHSFLSVAAAELDALWNYMIQGEHSKAQGVLQNLLVSSFEAILPRLERAISELSAHFKLKVKLQTEVSIRALDAAVLDDLTEILLHLIRNSFTHGFEPSLDRIAKGNDPEGHLFLSVSYDRGDLKILLKDDGRGIDLQKVQEKAKSLGLENEDLLSILTRPGFSTQPQLNDRAGFGLGLDIVSTMIQRRGGTLQMTTESNAGVQFDMRLPLRLVIADVLSFQSHGKQWAIVASDVVGVEPLNSSSTQIPSILSRLNDLNLSTQGTLSGTVTIKDKQGRCWSVASPIVSKPAFIRSASSAVKQQEKIIGTFVFSSQVDLELKDKDVGMVLDLC